MSPLKPLEEYIHLIDEMVEKYAEHPGSVDELRRSGLAVLRLSMDRFDPSRGEDFVVFAAWCIKHAFFQSRAG